MTYYRRNRAVGGTFFFTLNLLERKRRLLVEPIDLLREAVRRVRQQRPFYIDAWVVLPDHLHAVWTLPEGDSDGRIRPSTVQWCKASIRRIGPKVWIAKSLAARDRMPGLATFDATS